MLNKLNLVRADKYAELVTTYYTVRAVVAQLDGSEHCKRIGNEQGDVPEWDDIVLHDLGGKTIYCQVKRQITNFCDKKHDSKVMVRNTNKEYAPSPLDSAFSCLANIFNESTEETLDKRFYLITPYPQVFVKKELSLANLNDVLLEWQKPAARLEDFVSANDKHTNSVKTWLKTWCDFKSDEAIFYCLKCVEVHNLGYEKQIEDLCHIALSNWYQNEVIVREKITQFLVHNASVNHSLTPRLVASEIREYIKKERPPWVCYEKYGPSKWSISGTLSYDLSDIEPALSVVNTLWDENANRNFELRLNNHHDSTKPCSLDLSLIRLAIHAPRSVTLCHNEATAWKTHLSSEINGSLGAAKDDLRRIKVLDSKLRKYADSRHLLQGKEVREENTSLNESMDSITWSRVKDSVDELIDDMPEGEVQDTVEDMWSNWKITIDSDLKVQSEAMYDMLHAIVENNDQAGQLRAGLNTVGILSEAFETLLLIAIGLGASSISWTDFKSEFSLRAIALAVWCGTKPKAHGNRAKRFFTDDSLEERRALLGKETSKILVLPQASSSPSEILGSSLAGDLNSGDSMADARTPNAVITRSMAFNNAVDDNTIKSLKEYVDSVVNKRRQQREEHVQLLTTGY
ncbi:ABC-three component system protein [Vibrio campbellii]|uniref:ABC-three component system protein n=1 Tax=Vibrio campbellii TaxID=680 RepID=UPI003857AF99